MSDLHLIWTVNGKTLHGFNVASAAEADEIFSHGPVFPGTVTDPKTVFVTSSCIFDQSEIFLYNLAIGLEAEADILTVLDQLAAKGHGAQVSFDDGWNWTSLRSARVTVDPRAIITNSVKGILGPYDTLRFKFRVSVPADYATLGKISYRIGIDFDVL